MIDSDYFAICGSYLMIICIYLTLISLKKDTSLKFSFEKTSTNFLWMIPYKCFTCVTKTIANLATYSRKPENYNGTIIFEFDIMKNSSPIKLNLCQT